MFVPAAILGSIPSNIIIGKRIVPRASPTKPPSIPTKKEETPIVIITVVDNSVVNKLSKFYSFGLSLTYYQDSDDLSNCKFLHCLLIFYWWFQ